MGVLAAAAGAVSADGDGVVGAGCDEPAGAADGVGLVDEVWALDDTGSASVFTTEGSSRSLR